VIGLLAKLIERVHPPATQPDSRFLAFARGLALGALAGAAIAGSSIWKRNRSAETRRGSRGGDEARD